jgi:hypothetical protein
MDDMILNNAAPDAEVTYISKYGKIIKNSNIPKLSLADW